MKKVIHAILFTTSMTLAAGKPTTKQPAPPPAYEMTDNLPLLSPVFTLPAPAQIVLPIPVKKMVMFFVKVDPGKETIRRDEYNNVKDHLDDLCGWLTEGLTGNMQIYYYMKDLSWNAHRSGKDEGPAKETMEGIAHFRDIDLPAWRDFEHNRLQALATVKTITKKTPNTKPISQ